jgi:uncharacterized protein YyaL (SSP411 family)
MPSPIVWCNWCAAALGAAAAEHKPILLSLVTAWSAECAAMDETTYAHPDVVALVRERFVPIRVDADRRPDLNERYNLGGWPTTAFLTSRGDVLSGDTYMDATRMVGVLREVSDAYRARAADIAARAGELRAAVVRRDASPAVSASDHFCALLVDRFDPAHGGFGSSPKLPHPHALLFALSFADSHDNEITAILEPALEATTALWDSARGGFRRYAEGEDWSRAGIEKTLEDNAALLHVYIEAAITLNAPRWRRCAADIVAWARTVMWDSAAGGFSNVATSTGIDTSVYVDTNAMMIGAFIRAAALCDDVWLRDFALQAVESVIVPVYKPGDGVGHVSGGRDADGVSGLLADQIHVAEALIWAHAATGQLPYSMLAAEVLQFAIRTMWDANAECFRDRVDPEDPLIPFELNCHAARVLDRLAALTGIDGYRDRAVSILESLAGEFVRRDLFGAPYAVAVREVIDGRRPAGLQLNQVDWKL